MEFMRSLLLLLVLCGIPAFAGDVPEALWKRLKPLRAPGVYFLVAWDTQPPRGFLAPPGAAVEAPPVLDQTWAIRDLAMSAELGREIRPLGIGPLVQQHPASLDPQALVLQIPSLLQQLVAWKGRRAWVLLDARLRIVQESLDRVPDPPPAPGKVRGWMEFQGWRWKREALLGHLRKQPGDGQARLELVADLLRQIVAVRTSPLRQWILLGELEEQLRRLGKLPEAALAWEGEPHPLLDLADLLQSEEARDLERLREPLETLRQCMREALERDPESAFAWNLWLRTAPKGTSPDLVAALEAVRPVPGRPFPAPNLLPLLRTRLGSEPRRLAAAALLWMERGLREAPGASLPLLQAWGCFAFEAHLCAGQAQDALAVVDRMHGLAGGGWKGLAGTLRTLLEEAATRPVPFRITSAQQGVLVGALERAPLSLPPPSRPRPLQLARLDPRQDDLPWARLQAHPLLDPWGPSELSWVPLPLESIRRIRDSRGWQEPQGWALLREGTVCHGGPGLPRPEVLAAAVAGECTARLTQVEGFTQAFPERVDARRALSELLKARLPHPRHGEALLELLRKEHWPIGALSVPVPPSWESIAGELCSELAGALPPWPFQAEHWEAYADWSRHAPSAPRPEDLLSDTPTWPCLSGRALPGPLPLSVGLGVCRSLAREKRWEELDGWCRVFWERGTRDWLKQAAWILQDGAEPPEPWFLEHASAIKELLKHWTAALTARGQLKRVRDLRDDLGALDASLVRLMD